MVGSGTPLNANKIGNINKASSIAQTLTKKTTAEKLFSSKFGKIITGAGSTGLGMTANFIGMGLSIAANIGQEKAVNNMIKTVTDNYLQKKETPFIPNEAVNHSIQTHLQKSEIDLEE